MQAYNPFYRFTGMDVGAIAVAIHAGLPSSPWSSEWILLATDPVIDLCTIGRPFDLVAGNAFKIAAIGAHVDIVFARGFGQRQRQIAVLDVVSATGFGMAVDAVIDGRDTAILRNAARNHLQINAVSSGRPAVVVAFL